MPAHFDAKVLSYEEARKLFDSIETNTLIGLRDRALIDTMVYSFATVGGGRNEGWRLLPASQTLVAPLARKRCQTPRSTLPSESRGIP